MDTVKRAERCGELTGKGQVLCGHTHTGGRAVTYDQDAQHRATSADAIARAICLWQAQGAAAQVNGLKQQNG